MEIKHHKSKSLLGQSKEIRKYFEVSENKPKFRGRVKRDTMKNFMATI